MKHIYVAAVLTALTVTLSSCSTTSPVCMTSSVTPMSGKTVEENLGRCQGSDTAYSFLGLFMLGRPELDSAISMALGKNGGDTLINVRCYETSRYFLLFSTTTVTVEGDAVKFTDSDAEVKGKRVRGK